MAEQAAVNRWVVGSNPTGGAKGMKNIMWLLEKNFIIDPSLPDSKPHSLPREEKLKDMVALLDANGITNFVTQGTCLGLVREKQLIEFDHDIDIAFYATDVEKLKALVPEMRKLGFFIEEVTRSNLRLRIQNCKATMDLWILYTPNILYRLIGYKWWINNALFKTDYFNKNTIETVTAYETKFRTPALIETYLVEHYGATWRTPQKGHNAIYRGLLSQLLNKCFVDSPMPAKFSGVDHMNTWKPWVSWVLRAFFPSSKLTKLYKHPETK